MLHEKILVPLDGSQFSDQALVQARRLLRTEGAETRLLTAVDPIPFRHSLRPMRGARDDEVVNTRLEQARSRLARVQGELEKEGIAASASAAIGAPAIAILDEVARFGPSLVAMTTHGRSGLSRWVFGSVAQRVLRHCSAPLLLLRPQEQPGELSVRRVLVALDGSGRAEKVLPLVQDLAKLYGAEVVLFTAGAGDPDDPDAAEEEGEQKARLLAALEPRVQALRAAGVEARAVVEWGAAPDAIAAALSQEGADLLALTTHGRTGLPRFLLGSVAEKVLAQVKVPLLVLRSPTE